MKKTIVITGMVAALMCAVVVTASAQDGFRSKKTIYPVYAEMMSENTAVETSDCYAVVERKNVGSANGGNVTVNVEKHGKVIKTIHSASADTRIIKGIGYLAVVNDNFVLCELRNRNGRWFINTKVRNRHGSDNMTLVDAENSYIKNYEIE